MAIICMHAYIHIQMRTHSYMYINTHTFCMPERVGLLLDLYVLQDT